jgi:integration host factor subunit beta
MPRLAKTNPESSSYLNKADVIEIMTRKLPELSHHDVKKAVDTLLNIKIRFLSSGRRIELRGVGTFFLKTYKGRLAFNPKTNSRTRTPERSRVQFKPGKRWREMINLCNLERFGKKG